MLNGGTGIITYRNQSGGGLTGLDPSDQIMKSIMKR